MATKRLNPFERYLSLWVGLCMIAGVALGVLAPSAMAGLRQGRCTLRSSRCRS